MREILFRGQRFDNGEWVYGMPLKSKFNCTYMLTKQGGLSADFIFSRYTILDSKDSIAVKTESIGQFTELIDKNGNKIFEGDLVRWTNGKHYWEAVISTLPNSKTNTLYAIETYCNLSTYFDEFDEEIYSFERTDERKGIRNELEFLSKNIEIIGNIHEKK